MTELLLCILWQSNYGKRAGPILLKQLTGHLRALWFLDFAHSCHRRQPALQPNIVNYNWKACRSNYSNQVSRVHANKPPESNRLAIGDWKIEFNSSSREVSKLYEWQEWRPALLLKKFLYLLLHWTIARRMWDSRQTQSRHELRCYYRTVLSGDFDISKEVGTVTSRSFAEKHNSESLLTRRNIWCDSRNGHFN